MKILLVEDDENKANRLIAFVSEALTAEPIEAVRSYRTGVAKMRSQPFDLILLDMTMPTYEITADEEGGRPRAFGGRDILRQMDRYSIAVPVIVVTQFERFGEGSEARSRAELDRELARAHPATYRGMVYYDPSNQEWKDDLMQLANAARRNEAP